MNPRINRGVLQPTFSIVSKIYKYLQEITKLSKYEKIALEKNRQIEKRGLKVSIILKRAR